jgi:hypothetical protein
MPLLLFAACLTLGTGVMGADDAREINRRVNEEPEMWKSKRNVHLTKAGYVRLASRWPAEIGKALPAGD